MPRHYACNALTGNVVGALDFLWPGDDLPLGLTLDSGDIVIVTQEGDGVYSRGTYTYEYDATSSATHSVPLVIKPNSATTGRWLLKSVGFCPSTTYGRESIRPTTTKGVSFFSDNDTNPDFAALFEKTFVTTDANDVAKTTQNNLTVSGPGLGWVLFNYIDNSATDTNSLASVCEYNKANVNAGAGPTFAVHGEIQFKQPGAENATVAGNFEHYSRSSTLAARMSSYGVVSNCVHQAEDSNAYYGGRCAYLIAAELHGTYNITWLRGLEMFAGAVEEEHVYCHDPDLKIYDGNNGTITLAECVNANTTQLDTIDNNTTNTNGNCTHVQATGIATITHALGSQWVHCTVYDNNNNIIEPDNITMTNATTVTLDLSSYGALTTTWRYRLSI